MDQQWEQLRQRCLACRACSLAQERTQVVFGVGDPAAEVLLVGEAPGANEDKQGEPFVGRAGQLLDDMLQMIGLSRERIYITNSVKCRPPQNRDPLNTEKEACSGYLRRQMELMQPKILVCLGRISAMELIKPDFRITQEHGQFFRQDGMKKWPCTTRRPCCGTPARSRRPSRISSACRPRSVRSASGQSWIFNDAPGHTTFIIIL